MRLLLDECVPKRLKHELPGHDARTVHDLGWAGIKNGALLRLANEQFCLRNAAAHGKYGEYSIDQVNLMLLGVQEFSARTVSVGAG